MISAHCRLHVLHPARQWPKTHETDCTYHRAKCKGAQPLCFNTNYTLLPKHTQREVTTSLLKRRRLILHTGKSHRSAHSATEGEWDSRVKPKEGKSMLNNRKSLRVLYSVQMQREI